ncbi:MAG: GNAT family N-acetyltransferase [Oscillospiraceae bacterium]|nr:GNAT family N-acetyltransferase [Oscillospiraceae bacterium]
MKENQKVIGHLKIYPDENRGKYLAKYISYALSADYWGKGYMTEAVKRIIGYAFEEMEIDLLTAFHYPHNTRSKRVIEKCGFKYETTIKQGQTIYDGQVFDTVCYSILREDYFRDIQCGGV